MFGRDEDQFGAANWVLGVDRTSSPLDLTVHLVNLLHSQPLFFCFTFGFLIYGVLMYLFMVREHAHIRDNPKLQYQLARIKKDEEE